MSPVNYIFFLSMLWASKLFGINSVFLYIIYLEAAILILQFWGLFANRSYSGVTGVNTT